MIKTLNEIMKANPNLTYNEAVKIQKDMRVALEDEAAGFKTSPGVCITGALKKDINQGKEIDYHRYWKDMYEKEHKLRLEAEGETTIVKGIGMNSPEMKAAKARVQELEKSLSISIETNDEYQRANKKLIDDNDSLRDKLQVKILEATVKKSRPF
tara:strand:- start:1884 stop:2348 length:465 start_codon:yes stop_codon:yes gene_type:complete